MRKSVMVGLGMALFFSWPAVALAAPDRTPPTGTVKINNGAATTTSRTVTLTLTAKDNPGGSGMVGGKAGMQIRNDNPRTWPANRYERFQPTKPWTLLAGNGPKIVYVKFRDKQGNVMRQPVRATIQLVPAPPPDTTPPTGTLRINSGATVTATPTVTLTLVFTDTGSGLGLGAQMQFSNDGAAWSPPEPYAPTKPWMLTNGDGPKTVSVKVQDVAGNWSSALTATIRLDTAPPPDTTPPTAPGQPTEGTPDQDYDPDGTYTVVWPAASDPESGVTAYELQEKVGPNGAWTTLTSTATTTSYPVTGRLHNTRYRYRARAQNGAVLWSNWSVESDGILVDTSTPTTTANGIDGAWHSTPVTVTLTTTDTGSGVATTVYSTDGTTPPTTPYTSPFTLSAEGTYTVRYASTDQAGNAEPVQTAPELVKMDRTAPTGTVTINDGAAYTTSAAVTLTLTATDTGGSGMGAGAQMRFTNALTWSAWEPYATPKAWTLSAGDGARAVFAQLKDVAGNFSTTQIADIITLDTSAPAAPTQPTEGTPDEDYDADGAYTVAWGAVPTAVAYELQEQVGTGAWATLSSTLTAPSHPVTGRLHATRYAYRARAANAAGTWGAWSPTSDGITVDRQDPTATVTINAGAATTATRDVTLTLTADGTGTTVTQMRVSNDGTTWSAWEPYATPKAWTLATGDGLKTVAAQVQDQAGRGSAAATDTITLDTSAPAAPTQPTEGTPDEDYDADGAYTVAWGAVPTAVAYELQEQVGTGAWTTLSATLTTPSQAVTGRLHATRYAYRARAANAAGTWGAWSPTSDGITVDTTAPERPAAVRDEGVWTASTSQLTADWDAANDPESGIAEYQYQIRRDATTGAVEIPWTSTGTARQITKTGLTLTHGKTYYVEVQAKNGAGTWSTSRFSDGIVVDKNPPVISAVSPADGASYTEGDNVTVTVTASDADGDPLEYQFLVDGVVTRAWSSSATLTWDTVGKIKFHTVTVQVRDGLGRQTESQIKLFGYRRPVPPPN